MTKVYSFGFTTVDGSFDISHEYKTKEEAVSAAREVFRTGEALAGQNIYIFRDEHDTVGDSADCVATVTQG